MLNAAMVLMIIAGILGFPAVGCSGACREVGRATRADVGAPEGQQIMEFLFILAGAASLGSIVMGALVKQVRKTVSAISCFLFAGIFALLLIQMNVLGIPSALLLVIAGVMICVAPRQQFHDVADVRMRP